MGKSQAPAFTPLEQTMIKNYTGLVIKNLRTLESVPERLRPSVSAEVEILKAENTTTGE